MSNPIYCTFCGANQDERALLIVAHHQAAICDDCVQVAMDTVFKSLRNRREGETTEQPAGGAPNADSGSLQPSGQQTGDK